MSAEADRFRRVAAAFDAMVAATPPGAWSNPSPCEGWMARDVVGHVVSAAGLFLGPIGRGVDGAPTVDDDPLAAWRAVRDAVQAALDNDDIAATVYEGFVGPTTFADSIEQFFTGDVVIHGWDLARATGQDDTIDPAEVVGTVDRLRPFDALLRSPGVMGPAIEPASDADDQTKLLNYLGRRPSP